ncbi:hypothetical protein DCAR_0624624 [Daucus carota subsp. sativus]|uniref:Uncharacterized protein n=1 Tax=Daucus carota subsp. sativus TaxID=79200 RepID=A0A164VY43_DAUCS|nr:hypothetical protein DCAR_0624624 [Daucus carota subsp. sativus]
MDGNYFIDLNTSADAEENISAQGENSSELENNHSQEFNHINLNASPYESENFLELENTHSRKFKLLNLNEPPFEKLLLPVSVPEEVDIIDGQLYVEYNFMVHIEYIFLHMTNS